MGSEDLEELKKAWQVMVEMSYYTDLFSPETYKAFSKSDKTISGFRIRHRNLANKVKIGDRLICYLTKLSRWIGVLEVTSKPFVDDSPRFYEADDPFAVRFKVKPLVWLEVEKALPIHEPEIWNGLSFTRDLPPNSNAWTGKVRGSLVRLEDEDGEFLEAALLKQEHSGRSFAYDVEAYKKYLLPRVRGEKKDIPVSVPTDEDSEDTEIVAEQSDVRESIKIQALLADIGAKMGMKIWIPRNDRSRVLSECKSGNPSILERLPLNYDETTLKTIEQIDVLWLKGRSIKRAFEVEHTTSIYSGILRMADLLALQPNMDIKLHIVAPFSRKDKVFQELQRPVFSLLERGPLFETCTYLSYESVREIASLRHLVHLSDDVLEDYSENAED